MALGDVNRHIGRHPVPSRPMIAMAGAGVKLSSDYEDHDYCDTFVHEGIGVCTSNITGSLIDRKSRVRKSLIWNGQAHTVGEQTSSFFAVSVSKAATMANAFYDYLGRMWMRTGLWKERRWKANMLTA